MRLLLDEHLSAAIAVALRERSHDVIAVQEPAHAGWRGLDDAALFDVAQQERRAVVTENVRHFRAVAQVYMDAGRAYFGVLYIINQALPRHRHDLFVGQVVRRLDEMLAQYAGNGATSIEAFV